MATKQRSYFPGYPCPVCGRLIKSIGMNRVCPYCRSQGFHDIRARNDDK